MRTYPIPFNEEARLRALHNVPGLTEENSVLFDTLCDVVRDLLGCPIAHISVVDETDQWYKSVVGIELGRMPKDNSFCTHTILSDAPMVVPDFTKDPRFARHPMVVDGGPGARFYAGVPLVLASGHRFGSLCALDFVPHAPPDAARIATLQKLGDAVVAALEKPPAREAGNQDADEAIRKSFVTLIGHELRTPLTVMLGGLRMLEHRLGDPADARMVAAALKSAEHLAGMVETIIAYSNADTGELRLNECPVSLADLVAEIAEIHAPAAEGTGTRLTLAPDPDPLGPVLLDPEQIKLALTAVTLNALHHGGAETTLSLGTDAEGHVEIRITDTGNLGDHVDLAELYKPFVVGGALETRTARGGLGLGLPLTRKLVELHGGTFEVHPGADRTTALLRLPAWRAHAAA